MSISEPPTSTRHRWRRRYRLWQGHMARAARGRWALPALFAGSVVESSILPWPIEFPLLAYMLRGRRQVVTATLVVALGSAIGCLLSYLAGRAAYEFVFEYVQARPDLADALRAASDQINAYGAVALGMAMLSPVPVQVASFAAGAAAMSAPVFFIAAFLGRLVRYSAMGVVIFIFGARVLVMWARVPEWLRRVIILGIVAFFAALMIFAVYIVLTPGG